MKPGLSDFDRMWERLEDWGFDGRRNSDRPDPEAGTGNIYQMGKTKDRDEEEVPSEPPRRVNERDCDLLDGYIRQLASLHRNRICLYFYRRHYLPKQLVCESVRQVMDMEAANLQVRTYMRGRV
jgi:hypothetical protein